MGGGLKRLTSTHKLPLGFTVVELLIVIIVIAILATILFTAYNGVQAKAHNDQTLTSVRQYVQAVNLYSTEYGEYPYYDASSANNNCLGDQYPGGRCVFVGTGSPDFLGSAGSSTIWNEKVRPYLGGQLPMPSATPVIFNGEPYAGAYYYINMTLSEPPSIRYFLDGESTSCIGFGQTVSKADGGTSVMCTLQFSDLYN